MYINGRDKSDPNVYKWPGLSSTLVVKKRRRKREDVVGGCSLMMQRIYAINPTE